MNYEAQASGYRVGEPLYWGFMVPILAQATDTVLAYAVGPTREEAEENAKMLVACLNWVPR